MISRRLRYCEVDRIQGYLVIANYEMNILVTEMALIL